MLSLTRWNPLDEVEAFHREFDRVFGRPGWSAPSGDRSWMPAAEVVSDDDGWTVKMALPGIAPKDVNVEIDHHVLTVTGERATEETGEKRLSEIGYGRFERRFTVPETVDAEKVSAAFEHGMLVLTLPVSEATKPRQIAITGS